MTTAIPAPAIAAAQTAGLRFAETQEHLERLIEIPSCSFAEGDPADSVAAAQFCADWLRDIGMPTVELLEGPWPPYVLATDHRAGPDAPTLLLYSHYDVQPPLRESLWISPPYQPTVRNGRLYGRGSADDKAGVASCIGACDAWLHNGGRLPCNVTVWIEGEEETGSPHLDQFLDQHANRLQADGLVIADLGNVATGIPTLTVSLRGMATVALRLRTLTTPLHSGMWGGPAPDAISMLARLVSQLADTDNRPLIPDLVVPEPEQSWLDALAEVPFDAAEVARAMGLLEQGRHLTQDPIDYLRRLWYEPCISVNAIHAGGEPGAAGNVIMDEAWARVSLRLSPGMDAEQAHAALEARCRELCPDCAELTISAEATAQPWSTQTDHPLFDACNAAFAHGYERQPVVVGCGATIPFVENLCHRLGGVPALLVPVEDPDTRPHAENESVHLEDLKKTTQSLATLLGLAAHT